MTTYNLELEGEHPERSLPLDFFVTAYGNTTVGNVITPIALFLVVRLITIVVYRLYFHPLARFPGPKIAASSRLYEFWHQGIKRAQYFQKIKEMHQNYGPIVRISPYELSIRDSDFNLGYFAKDRCHAKDPWYYRLGSTKSLFTLPKREQHRERQKHVHSHLSGSGLIVAGPIISQELRGLQRAIHTSAETGKPFNFSLAYRRLGNDIIRRVIFGERGESNAPKDYMKDGEVQYHPILRSLAYVRHFPMLWEMHNWLPDWVLNRYLPLAKNRRDAINHVRKLIYENDRLGEDRAHDNAMLYQFVEKHASYRNGGASIAAEETLELIWGGRETLGHCLTHITYRVISNPSCMAKLQAELRSAPFELMTASYAQLQALPYLQAVCKESMRMQLGGTNRLPRVNSSSFEYKSYIVPANTPTSMCPNFYHEDEAYFPDPLRFKPERWLAEDSGKLERYFKPFGNGGLSCIGRYMAWEVVSRVAANVFSTWKMEFEGIDEGFIWKDGMLEVFPPARSHGLTVTVELLA